MKRFDRTSLVLFFFSFFICIESCRMDLGTLSRPGPGLFPFAAGLILSILSISSMVTSSFTVSVSEEKPEQVGHAGSYRILLVLCALIAYGTVLEWAGFIVTTFGLLIFLLKVIVPQSWARVLCSAFLSTVTSYVIFEVWLKAQLPRGFIGF